MPEFTETVKEEKFNRVTGEKIGDRITRDYYYPFLQEETIKLLEYPEFLGSVFNDQTRDIQYIKTHQLKKKKRVDRCKAFALFSFKYAKNVFKFSKMKAEAGKFLFRSKVSAKQLYRFYLETGWSGYLKMCDEILANAGLYGYKMKNETIWRVEFEKQKENPLYSKFVSKMKNFAIIDRDHMKIIQSRLYE